MDDLDLDKGTRLLCNTSVASCSIGVNKPGLKRHSFVSNIMDQKETSAGGHDSCLALSMVHSCTTRSILEVDLKVGACAPSSMGGLNIKLIQAKGLQLSHDRLSSLHPVALMIPPMPDRPVGATYSLWKRIPCWATVMPRSLRVHASQSPDSTIYQAQSHHFAHARRFLCIFSTFCWSCWPVGGLDSALKIALMGHSPHRMFVQLSWVCSL